jgi:hypothetical protein
MSTDHDLGSFLLVALLTAGAAAQQPQFAYERPITISGAGPHRLRVDATLLGGAQPVAVTMRGNRAIAEGGLGDLRLFDAAGGIVPYLLIQPAPVGPQWIRATTLPLPVTKTSSGFEADLGRMDDVDTLQIDGLRAPFLKRLTLEGSGDRQRWTVLVNEGTLFDLPNEGLKQTSIGFTTSRLRYLRVTWNDANSGRVGLPTAVTARRSTSGAAPIATTTPVEFERRASEPGRSRYLISLPGTRLPVVGLDLTIGGGHVYRSAAVFESRLAGMEAVPFELGRATLTRIVRDGIAAASLRVPIASPAGAELDLVIEDGGNPPLEVTGIAIVFAELPEIYFEAPAGPVVARYGDRTLSTPKYDLEAVRRTVDLSSVKEATWDAPKALTSASSGAAPAPGTMPAPGADLDPTLFQYARPLTASPGLAVVTLDAPMLAHSRGPAARFADVRVLDEQNRQIPYLVERRDEPQSIALTIEPRDPGSLPDIKPRAGRASMYSVTLPWPGLPQPRLVLETSERVFQRQVRIGTERDPDRQHRDRWFGQIGAATWQHADRQSAAPPLSIALGQTDASTLLVVVDEGDNAPLPLASVRLLIPTYRLRFYHPHEGALRLMYGRRDLDAPRYDLALLAPQVMGSVAAVATAAPESAEASAAAAAERQSIISPLTFWILLGGAVLVLVTLIVRLVKTSDSRQP